MSPINDVLVVSDNESDPAHVLYKRLQQAKQVLGVGIFTMGALLYTFREYELWTGYAEGWPDFLASEGISYNLGMTSVRLYQKYILELELSEKELKEIAGRDYTALDAVCKVINQDNIDEWMPKILTLGRQDIKREIRESQGRDPFSKSAVQRVFEAFCGLNSDEKQEFMRMVGWNEQG